MAAAMRDQEKAHSRSLPYFWDYDIDEKEFRRILDGEIQRRRLDRNWAVVRLFEDASQKEGTWGTGGAFERECYVCTPRPHRPWPAQSPITARAWGGSGCVDNHASNDSLGAGATPTSRNIGSGSGRSPS